MVKLGGNIDVIPLGNNQYKTIDGQIISSQQLFTKERAVLRERSEVQADKKFCKRLKKISEQMLIVGHSPSYVDNFISNEMENYNQISHT